MAELYLPVDFERLPEFRQLSEALRAKAAKDPKTQIPKHPTHISACAVFLWVRLWVELAYQAQVTNRPGVLTEEGAALFAASVDALFGDDCHPVELLVEARVMEEKNTQTPKHPNTQAEYFCERFARLNAHLAGNFVSKETRGANHSALVRSQQRIAHDALAQVMLLPPEIYQKRDGTKMSDTEINRCMVLIKTIDNCLKLPGRRQTQFTEGLICDASAIAESHSQDFLRTVYQWIMNHREHPALPKTTEQILAGFDGVIAMATEG